MSDAGPRLAFRLSQVGALSARRFADRLGTVGLTPSQAGTLRLLGRNPGIGQRELARRLDIAPSRVVVLLDGLEDKGLVVRRRRAEDRRHHEVDLTQDGRSVLTALREVAEGHEEDLVGQLSAADRRHLDRILDRIASAHDLDHDLHPDTGHT